VRPIRTHQISFYHSCPGMSDQKMATTLKQMHRCGASHKTLYRVAKALVTTRLSASSFFFSSSAFVSSISSWPIASLSAVSIFSLCPRLSLREVVGSEIISSTREMYDSSCCLVSKRLLNSSSLVLYLAASILNRQMHINIKSWNKLTVDHALDFGGRELAN
jgi:hypothetical protein